MHLYSTSTLTQVFCQDAYNVVQEGRQVQRVGILSITREAEQRSKGKNGCWKESAMRGHRRRNYVGWQCSWRR